MSERRFSVCILSSDIFTELNELNKESNRELLNYLRSNNTFLFYMYSDDRFRYIEDAIDFAKGVYVKNNSGDAIAIYDRQDKKWIDGWFL